MSRKEKNTLNRLLAQSKACFLNWILFNNSKLIISNPVLKIKNFKLEVNNE
ncbi:hypothetical protein [Ezakiella peruensis]|uniref:hypothetical protein n=1 Tax=Ezakiella peruensis TaxID=1464038 RepID=UPI001475EA03|nr:hypothetical protein [Ezakiella peruensis]